MLRDMALHVKGQPLGEALRKGRLEMAHLSQRELAKMLGVSTRTVQNWEAGKVPQPRHRRAIVSFLDELEEQAA
jgi:transcriptional regulator with XRE-family HTH domain